MSISEERSSAVAEQAQLMDGKALAKESRERLKADVAAFVEQHGYAPGLAVVLVGDDPPSIDYSRALVKNANDMGMAATFIELPASISVPEFNEKLAALSQDPAIHGISIQWPLPAHLTIEQATSALDPRKDVEGYHPLSTGRLFSGMDTFIPATPLGGMRLLEYYGYSVEGKTCLVVGSGVTVGRPLIALLMQKKTTILVARSRTPASTLRNMAAEADFIFTASGKARLITGDMVKPGAVVVDFGMSFIDGKMVGDVDVESVKQVARAVTTSPGVSGRLTSVALLENVLKAAQGLTAR